MPLFVPFNTDRWFGPEARVRGAQGVKGALQCSFVVLDPSSLTFFADVRLFKAFLLTRMLTRNCLGAPMKIVWILLSKFSHPPDLLFDEDRLCVIDSFPLRKMVGKARWKVFPFPR